MKTYDELIAKAEEYLGRADTVVDDNPVQSHAFSTLAQTCIMLALEREKQGVVVAKYKKVGARVFMPDSGKFGSIVGERRDNLNAVLTDIVPDGETDAVSVGFVLVGE